MSKQNIKNRMKNKIKKRNKKQVKKKIKNNIRNKLKKKTYRSVNAIYLDSYQRINNCECIHCSEIHFPVRGGGAIKTTAKIGRELIRLAVKRAGLFCGLCKHSESLDLDWANEGLKRKNDDNVDQNISKKQKHNETTYKYCKKHKAIEPLVITSAQPCNPKHVTSSECNYVEFSRTKSGKKAENAYKLYRNSVNASISSTSFSSASLDNSTIDSSKHTTRDTTVTDNTPNSPPVSQNSRAPTSNSTDETLNIPTSPTSSQVLDFGITFPDDETVTVGSPFGEQKVEIKKLFDSDPLWDAKKYREQVGKGWNVIQCQKCEEMVHRTRKNHRGGRPIKNCERCAKTGQRESVESVMDEQGQAVLEADGSTKQHTVKSNPMAGLLPKDFPESLVRKYGRLTSSEIILIAPARPVTKIDRSSNGRAKNFQAQSFFFANGSTKVVKQIPLLPTEVEVCHIKFVDAKSDFCYKINPARVVAYGQWLCENNKVYIHHNISFNPDRLKEWTPKEDGDISHHIANDPEMAEVLDQAYLTQAKEAEVRPRVGVEPPYAGFILPDVRVETVFKTEMEKMQATIQVKNGEKTAPLHENQVIGLMSLAFPTLFPWGDDPGFNKHSKANHTSTLQHFYRFGRQLYAFEEGKCRYRQPFSANKLWMAYACNKIQRDIWTNGCYQIIANSSDLKEVKTAEDVLELMNDPARFLKFGNKIKFCLANDQLSIGYSKSSERKLDALILKFGAPHLFLSSSAADTHWPELWSEFTDTPIHKLKRSEMMKIMEENSVKFNDYLVERLNAFVSAFKNCKYQFVKFEFQDRGTIHLHALLWLDDAPDLTKLSSDVIRAYLSTKILTGKTKFIPKRKTRKRRQPDVYLNGSH